MEGSEPVGRMPAPLNPPRPPSRWIGLLLTRRFWVVVGVVVVAALAVYGLAAVPVGPTSFSFEMLASNCNCTPAIYANHSFPNNAAVTLTFASIYTGAAAEYILLISNPAGGLIVYAPMETGYSSTNFMGNGTNYANVSATFTTTMGGAYEFELFGVDPVNLPALTSWVNGTYHAPILSI